MIKSVPFTLVPLILVNLIAVLFPAVTTAGWANPLFSIGMFSGASWGLSAGDLMVIVALGFLFAELMRSAVASTGAMVNHLASVLVLLVYVVEFIAFRLAANSTFFILTVMALVDVLAGFTITAKAAGRDVTWHQDNQP